MTKYSLSFKASVAKDLRQIPKRDVQSILKRIEGLADDPRPSGSEKLSGQERFRVRQGTYRIVYEIKDQELVVMVVKIGHRCDIYRSL
ncbi:type II toxin-antitoxin system RelE family toxin [Desulfomicrobium baculatum]|uniref:Plasmid stabilization system n=1 Tax=Desulfomicrobium baculatum (strain DSM 4028 / VKM B-1378 / X) TaxID=525897 RepID=C7LNQ6_DESBD|nr:type II toxin-antitoxin system RelE/ParE family toxin [Desulfomicrobium baculatum]ACU88941.1 plasmid stabilization system [Desulfomicrobium baculatum DSM 4028]